MAFGSGREPEYFKEPGKEGGDIENFNKNFYRRKDDKIIGRIFNYIKFNFDSILVFCFLI